MWPFKRNNKEPLVLGIYDPGETGVYRYKAGKNLWVDADPMDLVRRLAERADALSAALKMATSEVVAKIGNPKFKAEQDKAYDEVIDHLRFIFEVRPFKEGGLTEVQLMGLMQDFAAWKESIKKNWSQPSTTPAATSSPTPPPTPPPAAPGPPTPTTSGSGLTVSDLKIVPPTSPTSPPSCPPGQSTPARASGSP